MLFKVLERALYEADRVRRVLPTLVRFTMSELMDRIQELRHEFDHWRGACDHTVDRPRARKGPRASVKKKPRAKKPKI